MAPFKNKKVMKLSLITEQNGIPLNIDLYKGNANDVKRSHLPTLKGYDIYSTINQFRYY